MWANTLHLSWIPYFSISTGNTSEAVPITTLRTFTSIYERVWIKYSRIRTNALIMWIYDKTWWTSVLALAMQVVRVARAVEARRVIEVEIVKSQVAEGT